MSRSRFAIPLLVFLVLAVGARAAAQEASAFPDLFWQVDRRISDARRVFTSPVDPDVVFVAADDGLWRTTTGGADWQRLPKTSPDVVGTVASLTICPARPEFIVLGTDRGVFLSHDTGATWKKARGLAADSTEVVLFSPEDRGWRTILVCHGTAAAGISKSIDDGAHWRLVAPMRHFRALTAMGQMLVAASSTSSEPDNWHLARSMNYGESWNVAGRDIAPGAGTLSIRPPGRVVWGSLGDGLVVSEDDGFTFEKTVATRSGRWQSLFVTPGRTPAEQWFWAYDPFTSGLVVGKDFKSAWTPRNRGLYVDRMIRRGAGATASADGLAFYACVNGMLTVGSAVLPENAPVIRCARAEPASLLIRPLTVALDARDTIEDACERINEGAPLDAEITLIAGTARRLDAIRAKRRFNLRVRVDHAKGPAAVKSVTVTPDRFGLGPVTLFDDGTHGDGAAGDGLWGASFGFTEGGMWDEPRLSTAGRTPFPGTCGIPVVATDVDGNETRWTLVLSLFFVPRAVSLDLGRNRWHLATDDAARATIAFEAADEAEGEKPVSVKGKGGPWDVRCTTDYSNEVNVTGLDAVTFRFRASPDAGDVSFFLVDELTGKVRYGFDKIEPQCFSNRVALSRYAFKADGKFHTVRVPIGDLVDGIRFMRQNVVGFGLHADDKSPGGTYAIRSVRFSND